MRFFGRESHLLYVKTRDHGFKYAFEKDPRGLLHITGQLPISAKADVRVLNTELLAPGKLADSLVLVKTAAGTWLDHTEALSFWHSRERLAIMRRALTGALIPKYYRYKIYPTILLMLEEGLPKSLPETILTDRGGAFAGIRPNWVKLWESAAVDVLDLDRRHLLHLVPLMRHTRTEAKEAARRVRETGDEGQITLFLLLGERRYPKEELRRWIGMFHNAVVEIGKTTPFGRELIDAGRKEGRRKGREEGRKEGREEGREEGLTSLLSAIRGYLGTAFPALAADPAIDRITTLEQASNILEQLFRAETAAAARRVLQTGATSAT